MVEQAMSRLALAYTLALLIAMRQVFVTFSVASFPPRETSIAGAVANAPFVTVQEYHYHYNYNNNNSNNNHNKDGDTSSDEEKRKSSSTSSTTTTSEVSSSSVSVRNTGNSNSNSDCFSTSNPKPIILVTGVAGYIGSHTSMILLEQGYCILGIDNLSRGSLKALDFLRTTYKTQFQFELVDLSDTSAVDTIFTKYPTIYKVLHLAAFAFVRESLEYPNLYYENNSRNTNNLVDSMIQHKIPSLVFASTCTVYGQPSHLPITEIETKTTPRNAYGLSKLQSEQHILQRIKELNEKNSKNNTTLTHGSIRGSSGGAKQDQEKPYVLNARMFRYFNAVGADPKGRLGENPRPELLKYGRIWTTILSVLRGDTKCVRANDGGKDERDYIHVLDIANANMLALQHTEHTDYANVSTGFIWNVATNKPISTMEYIKVAQDVTGLHVPICEAQANTAFIEKAVTLHASASLLEQATGWKPKYTNLHEILSTAWEYSKEEVLLARSSNKSKSISSLAFNNTTTTATS